MGQFFSDILETLDHVVDHRDGVGPSFFVNGDLDALLSVDAGDHFPLFVAMDYPRHIFQTDNGAGCVVDHHAPHVGRALELVDGADEILSLPVFQAASGEIDVLLSQPGDDSVDAQPQVRNPSFVDFDVDLFLQTTAHQDGRHARHALQQTLDLPLGDQAEANQILVIVKADPQHRVERGIVAKQDRSSCIVRKLHQIQTLADIERR